jgi:hypothetical protein
MPKPISTVLVAVRIAALEVACMALHGAARLWSGEMAEELRRLADEMADRAERLRRGQ